MRNQYTKLREHFTKASSFTIIAFDNISNGLQNATVVLANFNETMAMKRPFFRQKSVIIATMRTAEKLVKLQKEVNATSQHAEIYEKLCMEWDAESILKKEPPDECIAMDLLAEVNFKGNEEQQELFNKLQNEHHALFVDIKETMLDDTLLCSKFSEVIKDRDVNGGKLLKQILNVD